MTFSRFLGITLRVVLLLLIIGAVIAWLTGSLSFRLNVGSLNVQAGGSPSTGQVCPVVSGASYVRTEGGREVWNVGGVLRLMKPKKHANACAELVNGVIGWRNPPGY